MLRRATLTTLLGLLTFGCDTGRSAEVSVDAPASARGSSAGSSTPSARERPQVANDLESMVQAALADAARVATPGASAPQLIRAEKVTWPDGSLGCPMPGRMYTMALVRGYRIRIRSGSAELAYHGAERGSPFLCPAGRATDPAGDRT